MKECKICGKITRPVFTVRDYKLVPLCMDCYKKNQKVAKNKYKKLMNKLAKKGYVWVLNFGEYEFPFTFFGLEVPFFQIVQYFFKYIDADNYSLQSQDDFVFDFNDYPDPIVTETCITFVNDNDGSTYSLNIRMGLYNEKTDEVLFFTDKQLGLSVSPLSCYAAIAIDTDNTIMKIVPDYVPTLDDEDIKLDDEPKQYMELDDVAALVGFQPDKFD